MQILPNGRSPSSELADLARPVQFSAIRGSLTGPLALWTLRAWVFAS